MRAVWSSLLILAPGLAGAEDITSSVGKKIDDFKLRDFRGVERSLADYADRNLVVVAFMGTECPVAKLYGPRLAQLAKELEAKGVAFIGINANQQDSITAIAQYAQDNEIHFRILKDVGNVVADRFRATRTPQVFLLDKTRTIRYQGRIDDQYGIGYIRPNAEQRDLVRALEELLAGKEVSQPVTTAPGCLIGRVSREVAKTDITYTKHIAPILQKRCVECHRKGEIAPFSLTSYRAAVGWAEMIEEVLREGRMPPWHADPKYGDFENDARVPEAEKQLIFDWIKNGAPEGDPKDLPKPAPFAQGWRMGKPDVIIRMPKPFKVPAQGEVLYQFFVADTGFKEDKWVQAAEVRPGCRAVVHHILIHAQPPGGGDGRHGGFASNWIAATVPGARPTVYPPGLAKFVPAGSRLLFQIHYTPNGVEQLDQSSVGFIFADPKTVRKEVSAEMAANHRFAIPPRASDYPVEATRRFDEDTILLDMSPHTHVRGKTFRYEAIYPDGTQEILLDLPRYDFNWQNTYTLAKPKLLPKGTQLHCIAHYDNSANNRANPDPNATVKWGDQTWEEMMIGYFTSMPAHQDLQKSPRPPSRYVPLPRPALEPELLRLAEEARQSDKAFAAFAAAVHKKLPKVDRICLTTVTEGKLRFDRVAYPGNVSWRIVSPGPESFSRGYALAAFALYDRFMVIPDLSKSGGLDLMVMAKILSSSAHVPIALEGRPGTVNFWSKEKDAFPKETHGLLSALGQAVVAAPKQTGE
jgi:peroxiredoxin